MLNREYRESFWYVDGKNMLLENTHGKGMGDASGRVAFAYIFFPQERWLKSSILSCIKERDDTFLQFYRYPGLGADTISRDHVTAIILAFYINRDRDELRWVLDNLPFRLSRRYWQTPDMWVWHRALRYEKWRYPIAVVFYLMTLFQLILIVPWNFLMRLVLNARRIEPVDTDKPFKPINSKIGRLLIKTIYPQYALFNLAWMVKVLPESMWKSACNFLIRLDARNPMLKVVAGGKMPPDMRSQYVPLGGFQWAGTIDRTHWYGLPRKLTPEESKYNDIMRGMIDYFDLGVDKIMEQSGDAIVEAIKQGKPILNY